MKLTTIFSSAIAALSLAACGSTVAPTVSPTPAGTASPTVAETASPTVAATASPTLTPSGAPTPTATLTTTPTPTTTPTGTTLGPSGVLVAQQSCGGGWTASVELTGFAPNSTTNYIVSVTNNLDPDGTDDVPYSGIPFGSDPEVDVNGLPIGDDPIWGVSGMGNVVGDFLMVTISPASGGNAGGVGYYGESTTVTAPTCPVVPTPTPSASPSASPSPTGCVPNPEQGYTGSCETPPVVTVTACDSGGYGSANGGAISWSGADAADEFTLVLPDGGGSIQLYPGIVDPSNPTPASGSYGPLTGGAYTYQVVDNTDEIFNGSFTILTCALPNA